MFKRKNKTHLDVLDIGVKTLYISIDHDNDIELSDHYIEHQIVANKSVEFINVNVEILIENNKDV